MTFGQIAAAAAILMLASACAYIAPHQRASTFYVMRHLHTPEGAQDPELTEEGQRHAQLLAEAFAGEPPVTIFVSDTRRAQQSAAPLAAKLGITPIIYDPADTATLITEVMKEPAPVLIVGHSNTVPEIVERLGGARPGALEHKDFGDLWRIAGPRRTVTRTKLGS